MPADLSRLRELLDAATPGPWSDGLWANKRFSTVVQPCIQEIGVWKPEDATLIAESRNALPALLDEITALRAVAEAAADAYKHPGDAEAMCVNRTGCEHPEMYMRCRSCRLVAALSAWKKEKTTP